MQPGHPLLDGLPARGQRMGQAHLFAVDIERDGLRRGALVGQRRDAHLERVCAARDAEVARAAILRHRQEQIGGPARRPTGGRAVGLLVQREIPALAQVRAGARRADIQMERERHGRLLDPVDPVAVGLPERLILQREDVERIGFGALPGVLIRVAARDGRRRDEIADVVQRHQLAGLRPRRGVQLGRHLLVHLQRG